MKERRFKQVDVFTPIAFRGNPVAVVLDGSELTTEEMQHFTKWTNLSEATFLVPPTHPSADYRARIFCPAGELPFAGHPTLGSCHAWLEAGGLPRGEAVVQECGAGLIRIRRTDGSLFFQAPATLQAGPLPEPDVALIARGLGISRSEIVRHAWCNNGPKWRGIMLESAEKVLALRPDAAALAGLFIGVAGLHREGSECALEVRAFFPGNTGLAEDPVTGSFNAALAQWLISEGIAPTRYVASQGTALHRAGRVHVQRDENGDVWVGGNSVTCINGTVLL